MRQELLKQLKHLLAISMWTCLVVSDVWTEYICLAGSNCAEINQYMFKNIKIHEVGQSVNCMKPKVATVTNIRVDITIYQTEDVLLPSHLEV